MFKAVLNPLSKYADKKEKQLDRLLNQTAFKSKVEINNKLLELIQQNLVVINLWLEKRFKGYKYLTKKRRQKLYQNTENIIKIFQEYTKNYKIIDNSLTEILNQHDYQIKTEDKQEKLKYISQIMSFLRPNNHYTYLEGASFGKLLSDIPKEKMIGDCNQIVTFYTFLYSLKHNINDLKIKLLENHVCLHFDGIDIEATSGTFTKYKEYEQILPIIELITTNLLDISDYRDKQLKINNRSIIKSAKLAHQISSHNEIVTKNLQVAYHNLAIESAEKNDYTTAKFFLNKLNNKELEKQIMKNAVIYYTNNKNFKKALYFLSFTSDPELKKYIKQNEGWYYFNNQNYHKALQIYQSIQDKKMVQACYGEMYNQIQKRVANITKIESHRAHKSDYQKMIDLADKMGNYELKSKLKSFLDSLK